MTASAIFGRLKPLHGEKWPAEAGPPQCHMGGRLSCLLPLGSPEIRPGWALGPDKKNQRDLTRILKILVGIFSLGSVAWDNSVANFRSRSSFGNFQPQRLLKVSLNFGIVLSKLQTFQATVQ